MMPEILMADLAATLAARYLQALRWADADHAQDLVDAALGAGLSPAEIQSHVITPAMVAIGDHWATGAATIADEHLATSISHQALMRLFQRMPRATGPSRGRVLLAAVEGQRHVLGLRMVADVLACAGYEVLFLGEDVPVRSLRQAVVRHRPHVVGLACGLAGDLQPLQASLQAIREEAPEARVMLGGRAVPPAMAGDHPIVRDTTEVVAVVEALLAAPVPVPV